MFEEIGVKRDSNFLVNCAILNQLTCEERLRYGLVWFRVPAHNNIYLDINDDK